MTGPDATGTVAAAAVRLVADAHDELPPLDRIMGDYADRIAGVKDPALRAVAWEHGWTLLRRSLVDDQAALALAVRDLLIALDGLAEPDVSGDPPAAWRAAVHVLAAAAARAAGDVRCVAEDLAGPAGEEMTGSESWETLSQSWDGLGPRLRRRILGGVTADPHTWLPRYGRLLAGGHL